MFIVDSSCVWWLFPLTYKCLFYMDLIITPFKKVFFYITHYFFLYILPDFLHMHKQFFHKKFQRFSQFIHLTETTHSCSNLSSYLWVLNLLYATLHVSWIPFLPFLVWALIFLKPVLQKAPQKGCIVGTF